MLINAVMVAVRIPLFFLATNVEHAAVRAGAGRRDRMSYVVGAIVGELWLRHRFGPMGTRGC